MASDPPARTWLLANEPAPVRLMNTIWADSAGVHDALTTSADLRDWIEAITPADPSRNVRPTHADLDDARELRDALRRLAAQVTQDPRPVAAAAADPHELGRAIATVNGWGQRQPRRELMLIAGRLERVQAGAPTATEAALADLATEAIAQLGGPDRQRLRACQAPGCVLYFSAGHPRREWCSDACGNRARAARHYQRVRTARSGA